MIELWEQETEDDCMRACLATLLDRPMAELPAIFADDYPDGESFWQAWLDWLAPRGLEFSFLDLDRDTPLRNLRSADVPSGLWIGLISAYHLGEDALHAIVMRGRRRVFDPSPVPIVPALFRHVCQIVPTQEALAA